jgi:formylglycine-generating enzyme required for sulfatase activity
MAWAAIDGFRKWTVKRKKLLQGLVGVAVEGVAECVPGGKLAVWATRIVGEFAKHGVERLKDTAACVPDVKPAGQPFPAEQLDQLNGWMASLSASYAGLLDRLDALATLRDDEAEENLPAVVQVVLSQHAELVRDFDAHAEEVRRQTLSLARIEERLDEIYHGQRNIGLSLEEIKALILQSAPPPGEWEQFRKARPEAVRLLIEADEHFLAGRRDEGMGALLRLFHQRGVGQATLCRRLGGAYLGAGRLKEAGECLGAVLGADGRRPAALTRTLTSLTGASTRGAALPAWRSLPRGFVIEERWRVEGEVGRGGMASVYRAAGIDEVNRAQVVAIKVPAPGLLDDPASRQRFVQEIQVSQQLSRGRHPAIVETIGYVRLTDPHAGRPLYGLVLEYIDGQSLAHWLALREAAGQPLSPEQIATVLSAVCAALEHAHGQAPPILHRDVKPHNVMLTRKGRVKLMDFGIARVLEDRRQTLTGSLVGTPAYLPPEFLDPHYRPDVRSDVYLAANLLVELLTFHPQGNPERRSDCPEAWLELISDAMSRVLRKRPATIREFRDRLRAGLTAPPPAGGKASQPQAPPERKEGQREIVNSIGMRFVWVKPGTFRMGSPPGEEQRNSDETPHRVTLTKGFHLGAHLVTQHQWERVMGKDANTSQFMGKDDEEKKRLPVDNVSWKDCQEFCRKLGALEGRRYRLPWEAEWEYACRAGTETAFWWGDSITTDQANYDGTCGKGGKKGEYRQKTTPVDFFPANPWGLHGMHGNLWQWCEDAYQPYIEGGKTDPFIPGIDRSARVLRGGSWFNDPRFCRAAARDWIAPGFRNGYYGCRVVLCLD